MNNITDNELMIDVSKTNATATLHLRGRFTFGAHREFKKAYAQKLDNPQIRDIVVDLSGVHYVDSSALGMLLVLRDHTQASNKNLVLSNPSSLVSKTFDIANFRQIFSIQ